MGDHFAKIDVDRGFRPASVNHGSGGHCAPVHGGSWVPRLHNVAWAETYLRTKWRPDPSNHLATIHQHYSRQRQDSGPV